jgi:hypothetical protein
MKSSANGKITSARNQKVELLNVSPFGLWLLIGRGEHFVSFEHFPFLADASIRALAKVQVSHGHHLRWESLDVDVHLDSLSHPEKFPLISRTKNKHRSTAMTK